MHLCVLHVTHVESAGVVDHGSQDVLHLADVVALGGHLQSQALCKVSRDRRRRHQPRQRLVQGEQVRSAHFEAVGHLEAREHRLLSPGSHTAGAVSSLASPLQIMRGLRTRTVDLLDQLHGPSSLSD